MSTAAAPDALRRKLGVGPGMTVAAVGAPEGVLPLAGLPEGTTVVREMVEPATASVVVGFTTYRAELVSVLARLLFLVEPGGSLWVAWPKRTSKVPTDLSDQVVRVVVLPHGWVDTKVCAIDDVWAGLRFVARRQDRPDRTRGGA